MAHRDGDSQGVFQSPQRFIDERGLATAWVSDNLDCRHAAVLEERSDDHGGIGTGDHRRFTYYGCHGEPPFYKRIFHSYYLTAGAKVNSNSQNSLTDNSLKRDLKISR